MLRTFDLYTVVPEEFSGDTVRAEGIEMKQPITSTSEAIADYILSLGELAFEEVRCDVFPKTISAVEAMQPVVDIVHAG